MREARAKNLGATPTLAENHTHFQAFLREASCPTCQSLHFQSRCLLRHAEVSHRSFFLFFFYHIYISKDALLSDHGEYDLFKVINEARSSFQENSVPYLYMHGERRVGSCEYESC